MAKFLDGYAGTPAAAVAAMRRPLGVLGSVLVLAAGATACSAAPRAEPSTEALAQETAFDAMTPASREVVRAASVRFLLLPAPYARAAIATSGPRWSALSASDGSLTVSLHGTDLTHDAHLGLDEVARAAPTETVRGAAARVLENEGIRSVAWTERGVDWSLEVECYQPDTDPRCTQDAFVLDLAAQLEEPPQ